MATAAGTFLIFDARSTHITELTRKTGEPPKECSFLQQQKSGLPDQVYRKLQEGIRRGRRKPKNFYLHDLRGENRAGTYNAGIIFKQIKSMNEFREIYISSIILNPQDESYMIVSLSNNTLYKAKMP